MRKLNNDAILSAVEVLMGGLTLRWTRKNRRETARHTENLMSLMDFLTENVPTDGEKQEVEQ